MVNALSSKGRDAASRGESEVAGARTQGLRIKSPLLYRLSYNLETIQVLISWRLSLPQNAPT